MVDRDLCIESVSYRVRYEMTERDLDVLVEPRDWPAGVDHAARHHKAVEGRPVMAALKAHTISL